MTLPRLYLIVDHDAAASRGATVASVARSCLDAGVRLLQVRAKSLAAGALLEVCEEVVRGALSRGGSVVVNDRADVALLAGAAGVHVGQDDLPPAMARAILGPEAVVGYSTHDSRQVDGALEEPISYLAVGPVFGTRTKDTGYGAVGLDLVRHAARVAREHAARSGRAPIPVVAIGGITLDTAASVIGAGATSVAVISDILGAEDPPARVRAYIDLLG